jgi:hypothetical protein
MRSVRRRRLACRRPDLVDEGGELVVELLVGHLGVVVGDLVCISSHLIGHSVSESGPVRRWDQAAIIFSLASGTASRKVCIGVLPKHQRP